MAPVLRDKTFPTASMSVPGRRGCLSGMRRGVSVAAGDGVPGPRAIRGDNGRTVARVRGSEAARRAAGACVGAEPGRLHRAADRCALGRSAATDGAEGASVVCVAAAEAAREGAAADDGAGLPAAGEAGRAGSGAVSPLAGRGPLPRGVGPVEGT